MDDIRAELIAIYNRDRGNYHTNTAFITLVDRCTEIRREEFPDFLTCYNSTTYPQKPLLSAKTPGRISRFFNSLKIKVLQVINRLNKKMSGKKCPIFYVVMLVCAVIGVI